MYVASEKMPKEETARQAEQKIRRRVACEERAYRIVEKLLEGAISGQYLTECALYITPSHYADIVEERGTISLCGYPVCGNKLTKVPKQKYYISTKSNKVYDITERKNFCSNHCFKASQYVEKQISNTPVWLRDTEKPAALELMDPTKNVGSPGLEVIGSKPTSTLKEAVELLTEDEADNNSDATAMPKATTTDAAETQMEKSVDVAENLDMKFAEKLKIDEETTMDTVDTEKYFDVADNLVSQKLLIHNDVLTSTNSSKLRKDSEDHIADEGIKRPQRSVTEIPKPDKTATDYLMKLLNKRKNLLFKMVDDQPLQAKEEGKSFEFPSAVKQQSDGQKVQIIENISELNQESMSAVPTGILMTDKSVESSSEKSLHLNERLNTANFSDNKDDTNCAAMESSQTMTEQNCELEKSFPKLSPQMMFICQRVSDWLTHDTLSFLKLVEAVHPDSQSVTNFTNNSKPNLEDTGQNLDERSVRSEGNLEERSGNEQASLQSTPDFHTIREQSQEFSIKVREFYKGSFTYKPPDNKPDKADSESEANTRESVLPHVDSLSQNAIRRKIVLQKLERSVSEMLRPLGLAIQHVAAELRQLVATFNLTSKNVILRPAEWSLVSVFLIKMLSLRIPAVEKSFKQGSSLHFYHVFLSSLGSSVEDVDKVLHHIYNLKSPQCI